MFNSQQAGLGFNVNTFDLNTFDAQAAMGFVVSQTAFIEPGVYQTVYPDVQYPSLIPVDTSAPEWIKTITFYTGDRFGVANWINANADDVPMAGAELTKFESAVYEAGIGYGFGYAEIRQAQMLGMNLDATNAAAARRASEEFIDNALIIGDARKNLKGFINHSAITPANAPTGGWATATADQIMADINAGIIGTGTTTKWTSLADTIVMSYEKLAFLASVRIANTSETLFSYIMKNNVYTATTGRPLMIRGMRGLNTAGVGATERMIVYRKSPEVLKAHIPMPLRFLPVYQAGPLRWEIPGIFRFGGLDIRLSAEVRYLDAI